MPAIAITPFTKLPRYRQFLVATFALILATTLFPIYVPKHSANTLNYYGMLHLAPWGIITPLLLLAGAVVGSAMRKGYWLASNVMLLLSTAAIIAVNQLSNTNASTPEPYTTISTLIYFLLVPAMLIWALLRWTRKREATKIANAQVKLASIKQAKRTARQEKDRVLKARAIEELQTTQIDYGYGAFLAIGGPIVGVLIWLGLWEVGFIASISAYIMVRLTISLYQKGSGSTIIDKRALWIILSYTIAGLLLSFFAAFTSDVLKEVMKQVPANQHVSTISLLTRVSFWGFDFSLLKNGSVLGGYAGTFATAVAMSVLGLFSTIKNNLLPNHQAVKLAKTELLQRQTKKADDWSIL